MDTLKNPGDKILMSLHDVSVEHIPPLLFVQPPQSNTDGQIIVSLKHGQKHTSIITFLFLIMILSNMSFVISGCHQIIQHGGAPLPLWVKSLLSQSLPDVITAVKSRGKPRKSGAAKSYSSYCGFIWIHWVLYLLTSEPQRLSSAASPPFSGFVSDRSPEGKKKVLKHFLTQSS